MTDDDKALVEELRHICCDGEWHAAKPQVNHPVCKDAADRIEAQAAEIERLEREVQKQRSLRDQYRAAWEAEKARAALGETE